MGCPDFDAQFSKNFTPNIVNGWNKQRNGLFRRCSLNDFTNKALLTNRIVKVMHTSGVKRPDGHSKGLWQ